jgi:3'-5' exoribonuclease
MPVRKNEPISAWEGGDVVQGFALVTKKELRQDRNGRSYLDMEVADASGSMIAKVWADSAALEADFEAHDFVALRGMVKLYRDQLQLSIDDCRKVTEEDRRFGFEEARLVPSTREDVDDLWRRLESALAEVRRPELKRLATHALAIHGERLREHPAAKTMHHAYRGGLLEHTVSMAELALAVTAHYRDLDRDVILLGVLFHDLGKLRELGAMPANDYTLEGRLVGHVVIGRDLLKECCTALGDVPEDVELHLEHLVLSHQGKREFAAPVEPMTPEALVLHFVDDLDSKLNQLDRARREGPSVQWSRGLGRYVYFAERREVVEEVVALAGAGESGAGGGATVVRREERREEEEEEAAVVVAGDPDTAEAAEAGSPEVDEAAAASVARDLPPGEAAASEAAEPPETAEPAQPVEPAASSDPPGTAEQRPVDPGAPPPEAPQVPADEWQPPQRPRSLFD